MEEGSLQCRDVAMATTVRARSLSSDGSATQLSSPTSSQQDTIETPPSTPDRETLDSPLDILFLGSLLGNVPRGEEITLLRSLPSRLIKGTRCSWGWTMRLMSQKLNVHTMTGRVLRDASLLMGSKSLAGHSETSPYVCWRSGSMYPSTMLRNVSRHLWVRFRQPPSNHMSDSDRLLIVEQMDSYRAEQYRVAAWGSDSRDLSSHRSQVEATHPESDGSSKRTNKTVIQCIRFVVKHDQKGWSSSLPKVRFDIMNTVNKSTGFTPFQLRFGKSSQLLPPIGTLATSDEPLEQSARKVIDQMRPL